MTRAETPIEKPIAEKAEDSEEKKARMAIAHKLALIIYRNLAAGTEYKEPIPKPMSKKVQARIKNKRVADLE